MIGLGTAILLGTLGTLAGTGIQAGFNAWESQKNRDFQERMANTSIQRTIADAQQAGISPMLALGANGAYSPGGSQASISEPQMANSVNGLINYITNDRKMDMLEKLQNEKLEHDLQITQAKMNNTAQGNFMKHDYKNFDFNSLFDDLDKVKFI